MEQFHGYTIGKWKNSNSGEIVMAEKAGKQYIIKRYRTVVKPIDNGALSEKIMAENAAKFDRFVRRHTMINTTLRRITGPGGNIIVPTEEFVEGNLFCEASEFIPNAVKDEELMDELRKIPADAKLLLMKTAAGALASVHGEHIVHSDLKPQNILLVRKRVGQWVAKLIDFDASYFVDDKPREIGGTLNYFSPEQGICSNFEGEEEKRMALAARVTEKSDIFSLGLIFHLYLAGELPTPINLPPKLQARLDKGKPVYCWVAMNNGCSLQLSSAIKKPQFIALIEDMLAPEPEKRPTASDVLRRLTSLDSGVNMGGGSVRPKKTALRPVEGICAPRPEDGIIFDPEVLAKQKIVGISLGESKGKKGYFVTYAEGRTAFATARNLLLTGRAKEGASPPRRVRKTPDPIPVGGTAEPWPEDNITLDMDVISRKGFIKIERSSLNGVNGYQLTTEDGGSRFLRANMLVMQKMAVRN